MADEERHWEEEDTPMQSWLDKLSAKSKRETGPLPEFFDVMETGPWILESFCDDQNPCCRLVNLYAKMALHRYNLVNKTNFMFSCVYKYKYSTVYSASSYYISLLAMDEETSSVQLFESKVDEHGSNVFALTAYLAKAEDTFSPPKCGYILVDLPDLPKENPFYHKRPFHVLTENHRLYDLFHGNWIRLYLELAVATTYNPDTHNSLSNLEIVKVSIETTGNPNEALYGPTSATFYISYKDPCEARVGKDVDRVAVVKRIVDEPTGCFTLMGETFSADIIPSPDIVTSGEEDTNKHKKRCTAVE